METDQALGNATVVTPPQSKNGRSTPSPSGAESSPSSVETQRRAANAEMKAGRFDRAEVALRAVLKEAPTDVAAQHDLGVALAKQVKLDEAIASFEKVIKLNPHATDARRNLGVALAQRGRRHDAAAAFQKLVDVTPNSAQCRHEWASALKAIGKLTDAAAQYREAILLKEDWAEAHHDLGLTLADLKRPSEAEEHYRQAIKLKPDFPEALNNLGILLEGLGRLGEAEAVYRQALTIKPNAADVHNNLGVALAAQRRYEEAVLSYRESLRLTPDSALALNNLGNSLRALGQIDEAVRSLRQAIRLRPDYAEAYNNLGIALVQLGRDQEAISFYERALCFRADYPEAHLNRSLAWLAAGDFKQGWTEYEWRWMAKDVNRRSFRQRRWDGCDLHGRTIFLYLEQGVGDTLQFIRYARLLKQRGARVIVEVQKSLVRLLSSCPHVDQVVPIGAPEPQFDLQIPLLSLPAIFRTTPETIPADVPYLFPDKQLQAHWRGRLEELAPTPRDAASGHGAAELRIAIAWQGNKQYRGDRQRSIPLKHFAALADVPGVRLLSLQKGVGAEQVADLSGRFSVIEYPAIDEDSGAFMDTAAIMTNVDLIVTSDTAIPHLAGALGVPVWMAVPKVADWRWMRNEAGSPWYPTMRIFRQRRQDDWEELFGRIADELRLFHSRRVGQRAKESFEETVLGVDTENRVQEAQNSSSIAEREHQAGVVLAKEGKLAEAEERLMRAVELRPKLAAAHHNLGVVRARQKRVEKAAQSFKTTLEIDPAFVDAYGNLGLAYYEQGLYADAVREFRQALRLAPGSAETWNNLGAALVQEGRPREAAECYRRALELRPDYAEAHQNLARSLLTLGQFEQGWLEYEWREKLPGARSKPSDKPRWDGKPLADRTALVYAEQGLGDTLQFVRYAAHIQVGGGRVVLECQPELVRLLANCPCVDEVVPMGRPLPSHDVQSALMGLPSLLGMTGCDGQSDVPYIFADRALAEQWRERLKAIKGVKIGIAWQGNPTWSGDRNRSVPLEEFQSLFDLPYVKFVNLQRGAGAEQLVSACGGAAVDFGTQVDGRAGPFMDTAAIVENLDLVITSDTSLAHLAGAMGKDVWVVLSYAPDWRWLMDRDDSPWYPTMRLFRQPKAGDWKTVFTQVRCALSRRLAKSAPVGRRQSYAGLVAVKENRLPALSGSHDVIQHALGNRRQRDLDRINLICPINHLGYGVVGLSILKGLLRAQIDVAYWPIGRIEAGAEDQKLVEEAIQQQKTFDGHAPSLRLAHQNHLAEHVGSPRVGFPIFELDRFTDIELNHLRGQDRLLIASDWARTVIENNKAAPRAGTVDVVPLGVDRSVFHERACDDSRPSQSTVFLSVGKWERRKGHDVLLEAFNKAFSKDDNVELWMLAFNPVIAGDHLTALAKNQHWETLYKTSPLAAKIRILPRLDNQREVAATMRQADCGVFLSRAEGWNLPALEMMSCGKQIIVTNYSAHTEYCYPSNSLLVDIDSLEDAHDDRWFFGQGRWAAFGERQLEQTIALMRQIHAQKQEGHRSLNHAGIETAKRLSWDNTVSRILSIF